tara:strand:- start:200 stop:430 length:231 start_codon:yes stop_codon:yes gene_type:complete
VVLVVELEDKLQEQVVLEILPQLLYLKDFRAEIEIVPVVVLVVVVEPVALVLVVIQVIQVMQVDQVLHLQLIILQQ